ncbi:hypothetical protein C3D69_01890 [Cronobacter sakazakii]|nr:hypothetical protein C3D69_01890 [Cronobacter sakazakii]
MQLVEENLALRKERERAEPVAYRYRFRPTREAAGKWILVDTLEEANPLPKYEIQPLYTAPPAPVADDSLPFDPQIAEYEQMMEAEQAQAGTTSQQFESLAGKAVVPAGWKLVPIEPTIEMQIAFAEAWFSKVRCVDDCELEDAYIAMLAAAPDFREISNSATKHFRENEESSTNGWIPCSERMPDLKQEVLCVNRWGDFEVAVYDVGYITGEPFFATIDGEFHPTHWQPLPEPQCK